MQPSQAAACYLHSTYPQIAGENLTDLLPT
jgi:hypothetical protein